MTMGYNGLGRLEDLLKTIKRETVPQSDHSDPGAIDDVWRCVFEEVDAMNEALRNSTSENARG